MDAITTFGKDVKKRLIDIGKTHKWLQDEITARTGLYCDSSYLYKIMTGKHSTPKILAAIREILDMPE